MLPINRKPEPPKQEPRQRFHPTSVIEVVLLALAILLVGYVAVSPDVNPASWALIVVLDLSIAILLAIWRLISYIIGIAHSLARDLSAILERLP